MKCLKVTLVGIFLVLTVASSNGRFFARHQNRPLDIENLTLCEIHNSCGLNQEFGYRGQNGQKMPVWVKVRDRQCKC